MEKEEEEEEEEERPYSQKGNRGVAGRPPPRPHRALGNRGRSGIQRMAVDGPLLHAPRARPPPAPDHHDQRQGKVCGATESRFCRLFYFKRLIYSIHIYIHIQRRV